MSDWPGKITYSKEEMKRREVKDEHEQLIRAAFGDQVGGNHYTKMSFQPLEYALANKLGVMEHAVVKYISRHKDKGKKQDLEKARDYIDKMIEYYYND